MEARVKKTDGVQLLDVIAARVFQELVDRFGDLLGRVTRSRPPQIHEKLSTLVLNMVAYHEGEPTTVAWQ